jgi:predicted secreted protein
MIKKKIVHSLLLCSFLSGSAMASSKINVYIDLDENENETSWELKDPSGNVVASGDSYDDNDEYIDVDVDVTTAGKYVFIIKAIYKEIFNKNFDTLN